MDEHEWDACGDSGEMLRFLQDRGLLSERKARLFAVACCRRIWPRIPDGSSRQAVETSERFADGEASFEELEAAFVAADYIHSGPPFQQEERWELDALDTARLAAHPETRGIADGTATAAAMAAAVRTEDYWRRYASEKACQCGLLRDLFGPSRSGRCRSSNGPSGPGTTASS